MKVRLFGNFPNWSEMPLNILSRNIEETGGFLTLSNKFKSVYDFGLWDVCLSVRSLSNSRKYSSSTVERRLSGQVGTKINPDNGKSG